MKNSKFKPLSSFSIADMPATGELCFVAACYIINGHSIMTHFDTLTCLIAVVIANLFINVMFLKKSSAC
jgi:hypothetical protein